MGFSELILLEQVKIQALFRFRSKKTYFRGENGDQIRFMVLEKTVNGMKWVDDMMDL